MDYVGIIIGFLGGLGMFIYGMHIMAGGLENAAGSKLKSMLEILTKNKLMGVCLGAFITAVIQSSSATTVMVVGFVNAGVMNLVQAMSVIMGANIGTTVTGWLVSSAEWMDFLSPTTLAPIAIMVGVIVMLTAKKSNNKDVASIVIGFGLLFVGISTMSDAVYPLRESESITNLFVTLGQNPILGIAAGAVVTAVIQSSSASVGILQSLAVAGLVPFSAAVYIIMGQNIGTCITAMLSSVGARKTAKTAAYMHLLFNIIGSTVFTIAAVVFFKVINPGMGTGDITTTEISVVHTTFNVITTILLFPASGMIIKMAKKMSGLKEESTKTKKVQLDDRMLQTPSIALQSAVGEVARMGGIIVEMLELSKSVMFDKKSEKIEEIKEKESMIDVISSATTDYAVKLSGMQISEREHEDTVHLLSIVSHMERVSDYCENISEFAEVLKEKNIGFSETAKKELEEMLDVCMDSFVCALDAYESSDKNKALKVVELETKADDLEEKLRAKHIKRLVGNQCNVESGVVYLDALISLERISDHARNIAEEVIERAV